MPASSSADGQRTAAGPPGVDTHLFFILPTVIQPRLNHEGDYAWALRERNSQRYPELGFFRNGPLSFRSRFSNASGLRP